MTSMGVLVEFVAEAAEAQLKATIRVITTDKVIIMDKGPTVFRLGAVKPLTTDLKMMGAGPGGLMLAVTQLIFRRSAHPAIRMRP